MFKRMFVSAVIFGTAAMAPPLSAQSLTRCLARDSLIKSLDQEYRETLSGGGLQSSQQLLEIWSSPETGTFTIFITHPNGVSCIVASGEHWQAAPVQTIRDDETMG